jgi:hypothetical protein
MSSLAPSGSHPPLATMTSTLPTSHFRLDDDLRKLRRLLGW